MFRGIFEWAFPLVKEIKSKEGVLHFRRWLLWKGKDGSQVYLHQICRHDEDAHEHDHPWDFKTTILSGGYVERSGGLVRWLFPGDSLSRKAAETHKILHVSPNTFTLVRVSKAYRMWGYDVDGTWVDHETYRSMKRKGFFGA